MTAIQDVIAERRAQDAQWGGPFHDDAHQPSDWLDFIQKQLNGAYEQVHSADDLGADIYRERLVKVAALAIAAVESLDRVMGQPPAVDAVDPSAARQESGPRAQKSSSSDPGA